MCHKTLFPFLWILTLCDYQNCDHDLVTSFGDLGEDRDYIRNFCFAFRLRINVAQSRLSSQSFLHFSRGQGSGRVRQDWLLMAMQAAAGILVVHARLDARIALRGTGSATVRFRRAAQVALIALACAAVASAILARGWIALALLLVVKGYWYDLHGQRDPATLQMPLKKLVNER